MKEEWEYDLPSPQKDNRSRRNSRNSSKGSTPKSSSKRTPRGSNSRQLTQPSLSRSESEDHLLGVLEKKDRARQKQEQGKRLRKQLTRERRSLSLDTHLLQESLEEAADEGADAEREAVHRVQSAGAIQLLSPAEPPQQAAEQQETIEQQALAQQPMEALEQLTAAELDAMIMPEDWEQDWEHTELSAQLQDRQLTSVPAAVIALTKDARVSRLMLSCNLIEQLSEGFACCEMLKELRQLDLYWNHLHQLPACGLQAPQLTHLTLNGNQLECIEPLCRNLPSLQLLNLHGNLLQALPDTLHQLTALTNLNVSANQLCALPPLLPLGLQQLYLAHNHLGPELPASLGMLTSLQLLNLSNNALTIISEQALKPLVALHSLNLSCNELKTLPSCVALLPRLDKLQLSDNPLLRSLPPELISRERMISVIRCDNNRSMEFPPLSVAELGSAAIWRFLQQVDSRQRLLIAPSLVCFIGLGVPEDEMVRYTEVLKELPQLHSKECCSAELHRWATPTLQPDEGFASWAIDEELSLGEPQQLPHSEPAQQQSNGGSLQRETSSVSVGSADWHEADESPSSDAGAADLTVGSLTLTVQPKWRGEVITSSAQLGLLSKQAVLVLFSASFDRAKHQMDLVQEIAPGATVLIVSLLDEAGELRLQSHASALEQQLKLEETRTVRILEEHLEDTCTEQMHAVADALEHQINCRLSFEGVCALPGDDLEMAARQLSLQLSSVVNRQQLARVLPLSWLLARDAILLCAAHSAVVKWTELTAAIVSTVSAAGEHQAPLDDQLLGDVTRWMQTIGEVLILKDFVVLQPQPLLKLLERISEPTKIRGSLQQLDTSIKTAVWMELKERREHEAMLRTLRNTGRYHLSLSMHLWPKSALQLMSNLPEAEAHRVLHELLQLAQLVVPWDDSHLLILHMLPCTPITWPVLLLGPNAPQHRVALRFELQSASPRPAHLFMKLFQECERQIIGGACTTGKGQQRVQLTCTAAWQTQALFGCDRTRVAVYMRLEETDSGNHVVELGGDAPAAAYTQLQQLVRQLADCVELQLRTSAAHSLIREVRVLCPRCLQRAERVELHQSRSQLQARAHEGVEAVHCLNGCWSQMSELLLVTTCSKGFCREACVRIVLWDSKTDQIISYASGFIADAESRLVVTAAHLIHKWDSKGCKWTKWSGRAKENVRILVSVCVAADAANEWRYCGRVMQLGEGYDEAATQRGNFVAEGSVDVCVIELTHLLTGGQRGGSLERPITTAQGPSTMTVHTLPSEWVEEAQRIEHGVPVTLPALQMGASQLVTQGDTMLLYGFPGSDVRTSICITPGSVTQFLDGEIVLSNFQEPGASGGPAVNDMGHVIGILSKGNNIRCRITRIHHVLPHLHKARNQLRLEAIHDPSAAEQ